VRSRFFISGFQVMAVLLACTAAFGQSQQRDTPKTPESPQPTITGSKEGVGAAVDPNKYLIGPEDILFIKTWREPDFTFQAAVRPDGKITVPLISDMQAAGLTPQQLAKSLTEALGKLINTPDVNVFVQDVRSKKYYIDGEVSRPGGFPLVTPTTVLEALSNCGGFKEFANQKNIRILRGGTVLKFNYKEVTSGKKLEQNIYLESGDHVIVR
jgi:polysaccharide export outer membrane protein